MRPRALLAAAATAAAVAFPSAAALPAAAIAAARSQQQAAPDYPNTRLAIAVKGRPRAGAIATVVVSGSVEARDPPVAYEVDLFVQDPRVIKRCPASYDAQLDNVINLSDHVARIGRGRNAGSGGAFRIPVKYQTGSTRRVLFCAYARFIVDDAAVAGLRHTFARAAPRR
jgi:hypothetical protein